MPFLTDLENAITAQHTVLDSVAVLLNKITDELSNVYSEDRSIGLFVDEVQHNIDRLCLAVIANTPGGHAVVTPIQVSAEVGAPVVVPLPVNAGPDTMVVEEPSPVDSSVEQHSTLESLGVPASIAVIPEVAPEPAITVPDAVNGAVVDNAATDGLHEHPSA